MTKKEIMEQKKIARDILDEIVIDYKNGFLPSLKDLTNLTKAVTISNYGENIDN